MQDDSADELHVEMPHRELPASSLARQRKRRNHHFLERLLQPDLVLAVRGLNAFKPRGHLGLQRSSPLGEISASLSPCISGSSALICATIGTMRLMSRSCFVPMKRAITC